MFLNCLFINSLFAFSFAYSAGYEPGNKIIELYTHHNLNYEIRNSGDKVDVRLYYESMCPYCIDFYTDTLTKTIEKLGAYIYLKTYPYGNAERKEENGKTVIECQHGEEECYGNKLHACAIDLLKNTTRSVSYISCMMSGQWKNSGSDDKGATRCGNEMGINAKKIIECAKGKKGEQLLEYYGKETEKDVPDKEGVPWSLVNGKYVEHDKWLAAICAALDNPPPQCKKMLTSARWNRSIKDTYVKNV